MENLTDEAVATLSPKMDWVKAKKNNKLEEISDVKDNKIIRSTITL